MGTLSYTTTVSLDGFVADADGDFQWGAPTPEVFRHHVERVRALSAEIMGRRTYDLMRYWHTEPEGEAWTAEEREFAHLWREVPHIVVSSTLRHDQLVSDHDRLLPELSLPDLARLVEGAAGEVEIFGPTTAAPALRAGMVDDLRTFIAPQTLGGGLRALPEDLRLELRLVEHRVFDDGTVHLHHRPRRR
ncbi:MAG: dihydrofolate reductase family protein [Nesterenkonia sp.]|uniref:dihydrofolate reductase family protein n=1 Tax=Nesterenkonia marinintestina TaxID=2979865 RepID=UPI0021BECAE5|nr:dihydrofolate reductase family protein [Nesterenkonia sp. GX14115]MDO5492538.1 dihydrofolate reductase family protein [Nesterenkonia sp.]